VKRPAIDRSLDPSRAAERARDPAGWRMQDAVRSALAEVIDARRDVRRFRADPVSDAVLERTLLAANRAPSVGLSQPWRFIVIRDPHTRAHARAFLDQKVEGVLEAPIGVCVCCVPPGPGVEVLGRATIPQTDVYSTACAVQNLWLTARAEGLGVGWVSFYDPAELRAALGIPEEVEPVAWLCVGWPDERPTRPGLERAGWATRRPLEEVLMHERWARAAPKPGPSPQPDHAGPVSAASGPTPDARARTAVRDYADRLLKPLGSLGALEDVVERWAAATGSAPPAPLRAAHLVCAADHGHATRGSSLFAQNVTAQVAAAAARGETAIAVIARARGEELVVADVGLAAGTPPGCVAASVRAGTEDTTVGAAMSAQECRRAIETGAELARELLSQSGADCLVLGEIGIGNTTTAALLVCALMGALPAQAVGRGTGLDAHGLLRKRELVGRALRRHSATSLAQGIDPRDAEVALAGLGGLELAALTGATHAAHERRVPVLLDGMAVGVAALIACRLRPACREWLFAGHRSAEPVHGNILAELGLEPLLDLRLRLGEGSGAALALPLVEQAGLLQRELATFEEAGVDVP